MLSPAVTALADQLDAATREALDVLHAVARHEHEHVITDPPSPWLAAQIAALLAALATGQARACRHLTSSPRRAHAVAWRPGVIACPACRHLLDPGPIEEHTCDRCRTTARTLNPCLAAAGPILFGFGLCPTCVHVIAPNPGNGHR